LRYSQRKNLTKEKQKRIEELVRFDEKSVEKMLDFTLDTEHEEEKHPHHLRRGKGTGR